MLYDNDRLGGNASVVSSEFTATDGSGSTIHIWYDNQEDTPVKVMLYQYGWLGFKTAVLEFEVAGGTAVGEDYTAIGANSGKYYICVQANDGGDITGHLRADQTY